MPWNPNIQPKNQPINPSWHFASVFYTFSLKQASRRGNKSIKRVAKYNFTRKTFNIWQPYKIVSSLRQESYPLLTVCPPKSLILTIHEVSPPQQQKTHEENDNQRILLPARELVGWRGGICLKVGNRFFVLFCFFRKRQKFGNIYVQQIRCLWCYYLLPMLKVTAKYIRKLI